MVSFGLGWMAGLSLISDGSTACSLYVGKKKSKKKKANACLKQNTEEICSANINVYSIHSIKSAL